jgi:peptidylprolyl isomerase
MTQAKDGDKVKVNYSGKLTDGTEFDSSEGHAPLEFTIGENEVIPGFENAVIGMSPGQSKTITVASEQAYGPRQKDLMVEVDRKDVPADLTLEIGARLEVTQEDGDVFMVTVSELSETSVTLDANHPLAGEDLVFEINLLEIA